MSWSLLGLLCINQCLAYASTFFRSTLSGLQLYKTDALISSVDRLTMLIGGTSILIWGLFPISVITFIYLQTFGYLVAMLVSLSTLIPHLKVRHTAKYPACFALFKTVAAFCCFGPYHDPLFTSRCVAYKKDVARW
jgi:Na+/pantothenate symporter